MLFSRVALDFMEHLSRRFRSLSSLFSLRHYALPLYSVLSLSRQTIDGAMSSQGPYNYAHIFKYIIIGDMGVGKSCLLHQFTEKKVGRDARRI